MVCGGGTGPDTYTTASETITLFIPDRNGYTFVGWYEDSGFSGNAVRTIPTGSTGNKTFYAKWEGKIYTVTFDGNGGGTPSPAAKIVTFGEAYGTLPTLSRTGYRFDGWYTAASDGTQVTKTTIVALTADQTLYARWMGYTSAAALGAYLKTVTGTSAAAPITVHLELNISNTWGAINSGGAERG